MSVSIISIASPLHDAAAVNRTTEDFLASLHVEHMFYGADFSHYGEADLSLIFVCTGGTEGVFLKLLPELRQKSSQPIYLLTSGKSNSLAASAEILSYLRQNNLRGEILHGSAEYIVGRIEQLLKIRTAQEWLTNARLGVIGKPSDWLISSNVDYETVKRKLGLSLVDVPMGEVKDELDQTTAPDAKLLEQLTQHIRPISKADIDCISQSLPGALKMYQALKSVVKRHDLNGFTIRCFDLLTAVHNTGCTALALLNDEGYVAGCEGDVPTALSMIVSRALLGISGFQANPARINPETGELLFAHCTIPLNMVERYELDTHFESGIGVGIRGYMKTGAVTLFKLSPDLSRCYIAEGELLDNQDKPNLCRTQQIIRLDKPEQAAYFLTNPIGNHHVILPGHHGKLLKLFFNDILA